MYRGNFRILVFIDLLATALGSSIILMLIISVNKGQSAAPAGNARDFIYYKAYATNEPDAQFKVIIKSGDSNEWTESGFSETASINPGAFLGGTKENNSLYIWGPVQEYDTSGTLIHRDVYNVYSTVRNNGKWIIGLPYYNNKKIGIDNSLNLNDSINVVHELKLPGMDVPAIYNTTVSLGNYCHIDFTVEPNP